MSIMAEVHDWPKEFFTLQVWPIRRPKLDERELAGVIELIRAVKRPVSVCGDGSHDGELGARDGREEADSVHIRSMAVRFWC